MREGAFWKRHMDKVMNEENERDGEVENEFEKNVTEIWEGEREDDNVGTV